MIAAMMQKIGISCVKYLKNGAGLAIDNPVIVNIMNKFKSNKLLHNIASLERAHFSAFFLIQTKKHLNMGTNNRNRGKM